MRNLPIARFLDVTVTTAATLAATVAFALPPGPGSAGPPRGSGDAVAVTLPPVRGGAVVACDQMAMIPEGTYDHGNGNAIGGAGVFSAVSDLQLADDCALATSLEITQVCQASVAFTGLTPAEGLWVQVYADAPGGVAANSASYAVVATDVTATPFVDKEFGLSGLILCADLPAGFVVPAGTWWWSLQPVSVGPGGDWYYQARRTGVAPHGGDTLMRDGAEEHGTAFGGPYAGFWGTSSWVTAKVLGYGAGDAAFRIAGVPPTAKADLAVTKTDGEESLAPGSTVTYTIVVTNHGPGDAPATEVIDLFPEALEEASWTCSATTGSNCTAAGVGDLVDTADILANGSVTYVATAMVSALARGAIENSASATPGPKVVDPVPQNDAATDVTGILAPSVVEVPTVTELGLASLITLLVAAGLWTLGRQRR